MDIFASIPHLILQTIYLGLPAIAANIVPLPLAKLPVLRHWNMPMDFGKTRGGGQRILGDHKTWRGFIGGIVAALLVTVLQQWLGRTYHLAWLELFDYQAPGIYLAGFLLGFGAMAGDAIRAYFKRRRNLPPGARWFPWDNMDSTAGAILLLSLSVVYFPGWQVLCTGILLGPAIHLIANPIGYLFGWKKVWW